MNPNLHPRISSTPLLTDQQPSTSAQQQPAGKKTRVQCDRCEKTFSNSSNCKKHIRTVHERAATPYGCSYCEKKFTNKYDCKRHEFTHTEKKNLQCRECGKFFYRKDNFDRHRYQVHKIEKNFKCLICKYYFKTQNLLDKHVLTHTEKKTFQCGICGIFFTTQYSHDRHMNIFHQKEEKNKKQEPIEIGMIEQKETSLVLPLPSNTDKNTSDRLLEIANSL